jgi:hypothetical protein
MRAYVALLAICFLVLSLAPSTDHAQALTSREVRNSVNDYVAPQTTPDRREVLFGPISCTPQGDIVPALRRWVRRDAERPQCVELARRLHLRGTFTLFERYLEENPQDIAALGLITNDRGAVRSLLTKWKEAELESELFESLHGAFMAYGIEPDVMEDFRKLAADDEVPEERRAAAAQVLAAQTSLDAEDVEGILEQWDELKRRLNEDGKRLDQDGMLLSAAIPQVSGDIAPRRLGPNWIVGADSGILFTNEIPDSVNQGGYLLNVWVKVVRGDSAFRLGLRLESGEILPIRFERGVWYMNVLSGARPEVRGRVGEWTKVSLVVSTRKVQPEGAPAEGWSVQFTVDDNPIGPENPLFMSVDGFAVNVEAGEIVVGALEYIRVRQ